MSVFIGVTYVAGVQPAVFVDSARGSFRIIQIALHILRSADTDLAFVIRSQFCAGSGIDELAFCIRRRWTDGAELHFGGIGWTAMRNGTGFSHAVSLANATADALHAFARKLRTQRRRA